jgi:presequence protease
MQDKIHGFSVIKTAELPEIEATLYEMEHDKTGAKLVWLKRDDENKTFGIAFKTLPFDDSGVFHILEHSVLCGSKKYPVKEPFVELLKSSLNTFLNAMTFQDRTVYPVSSKNDKDFLNLMRVYLDAVFYPSIYSKPEIFMQEGWHLEKDENGKYIYKGVVLNEMKGAFASPEELVVNSINTCLFPDSPYKYVSGGDPEKIPTLTYETFIDTHKKFYSPSNSYIFLDGDLDIDLVLGIINDEYLSNFEKTERIPLPKLQEPVAIDFDGYYEVSSADEMKDKTRLCYAMVVGKFDEKIKIRALHLLSSYLTSTNQSPLSLAVVAAGLAENITMSVSDDILQPWLCIDVENVKDGCLDKVKEAINNTLINLVENGLDHEELEAIMTNSEFKLRERDYGSYPKGLVLSFDILESWMNGGKTTDRLLVGDMFDILREKLHEGYFEELINEVIFQNAHCCQVIYRPSYTLGEERRANEQARIEKTVSAMTEEEKNTVAEKQQKLLAWQESEDTEENLSTLPKLSIEDIPLEPDKTPTEVIDYNGTTVLLHKIATGGIVYARMYFDVSGLNEDELSNLALASHLFGRSPTKNLTLDEVTNKRRLLCGSFYAYFNFYLEDKDRSKVKRMLCVYFSALESKLFDALNLVIEIVTNTNFVEDGTHAYLRQLKSSCFEQVVMSGNSIAVSRLAAQYSPVGVLEDTTDGIGFYNWLKNQDDNWNFEVLNKKMQSIISRVISKNGLIVSLAGSDEYKAFAEKAISSLPDVATLPEVEIKPWGKRKEGIIVPSDTCFAVMGSYNNSGYNGQLLTAAQIVSLAYLWNVIRVQGGAYGTGLFVRDGGLTACYSYRDPNGANSLQAYRGISEFLRMLANNTDDLTDFIIGTVSGTSSLMTPRSNSHNGDRFYFIGRTWEDRCRIRRELLSTKPEDLLAIADELETSINEGGISVIGGKEQIANISELDTVIELKS